MIHDCEWCSGCRDEEKYASDPVSDMHTPCLRDGLAQNHHNANSTLMIGVVIDVEIKLVELEQYLCIILQNKKIEGDHE